MPAWNPPKEINGVQLSERTQWLLFAPTWMLFPVWRKRVMSQPIYYSSPGVGMLRNEFRPSPIYRWNPSPPPNPVEEQDIRK